jgi:hypothetical protein
VVTGVAVVAAAAVVTLSRARAVVVAEVVVCDGSNGQEQNEPEEE